MVRTLLTDRELHERYPQLSIWSINEMRRRNQIPHLKLPGIRKFLYDLEAVEKWLGGLYVV